MYKGGFHNEPVVLQRGVWPQPKKDFIPLCGITEKRCRKRLWVNKQGTVTL